MARKRRRRRTGGNDNEELIREEIESTVEDAIDDAVGELNIKTNKQRAKEIKEQLEKNLSAYDAMLRDQLITSTKRMFSRLSSDTSKAFGDLKGAEVSEDIRKHVSGIVRMIENSFLYDLGESKDAIAQAVSEKNADFMNQIIENLSKDMAQGKIYHGPQTEAEKGEMGVVLDDAFERLNDMAMELQDMENVDKKMIDFISDLMHTVSSGLPEDKIYMQINKALKNQGMMEAAPAIKDMLDNIISNYKSFANENFEDEVRQMQDFHSEQGRISNILAFNMDMFVDGIRGAIAGFANFARDIKESEKQLYAIAAISDMSAPQIDSFRSEMMNLAVETPFAANVMTEAYGELVRTGKTAEESMIILKGVTDLAVASFEPLEKVASAVNSLMLAMEMSADTAGRVSSSLFSVLNATPLGFESLNNALTQTGAAFNAVIGQTSKTGEELENYKMAMTDLQASMIGGMSLLGKTGSQAGTAIRNMTTRLSSMESAAKTSLQSDLDKMGGFSYEGAYIRTHEDLTALAQEDFGKVTEALSQMVKQGALSFDTLRKMFTGRNVTQIVGVLSQIDGNLDSFVKSMTGDADALEKATEIASRSWVQQYDQFTQTMSDLKTYIGGGMDVIAPLLYGINELSSSMAKLVATSPMAASMLNALGVAIVALTAKAALGQAKLATQSLLASAGLIDLSTGLAKITSVSAAFKMAGAGISTFISSLNPIVWAVAAISGTVAGLLTLSKKGKASQDALSKAIESNMRSEVARKKAIEGTTKTLSDVTNQFKELKSFDLGDDITKKMNMFMIGMGESATAVSSLTQSLSTFLDVVMTSKKTLDMYSEKDDLENIKKFYAELESSAKSEDEKKEIAERKKKAEKGLKIAQRESGQFGVQAESMGLKFSTPEEDFNKRLQLREKAAQAINLETYELDEKKFEEIIEADAEFGQSLRLYYEELIKNTKNASKQVNSNTTGGYDYQSEAVNAVSILKSQLTKLLPSIVSDWNIGKMLSGVGEAITGEMANLREYTQSQGEIEKATDEAKKSVSEAETMLRSKSISVIKGNTEALNKEILDVVKVYEASDGKDLKKRIDKLKGNAETKTLGEAYERLYNQYVGLYGEANVTGKGFEKFALQQGRAIANAEAYNVITMSLLKDDTEGIQKYVDAKAKLAEYFSKETQDMTDSIDEDMVKLKELKNKKGKTDKDNKEIDRLTKAIYNAQEARFISILPMMSENAKAIEDFAISYGGMNKKLAEEISDKISKINKGEVVKDADGKILNNIDVLADVQKKLRDELAAAKVKGNNDLVRTIEFLLYLQEETGRLVNDSHVDKKEVKIDMKLISTRLRELNNEINKTILDMLPDSTKKFSQISAIEDSDLLLSTFQDMQSFIKGKVDDADLKLDKGKFERTLSSISESLSFDTLISEYKSILTNSSLKLTESEKKEITDKLAELQQRSNKAISDYNTNYFQKAISSLEGMMSSSEVYTPEMGAVIESYRQLQFELIDAMKIGDDEKVRLKKAFEENVSKMRKENISRMVFDQNKEGIMEKLDSGRPQAARGIMDQMDQAIKSKYADVFAYQKAKATPEESRTKEEKEIIDKYNKDDDAKHKILDLTIERDEEQLKLVQLQAEVAKKNADRLRELYGQLGEQYENMFMTVMGYGSAQPLTVENSMQQIAGGIGPMLAGYQQSQFATENEMNAVANMDSLMFKEMYGEEKTDDSVSKKQELIYQKGQEEQKGILSEGFKQIGFGLMNLAKAKAVEKAIEKINDRLSDIDSRQKDIDRKKQVADDIQEKAALFNEEQVLESERIALEIELSRLQDQEMMVQQTEELVNILNEIRALRSDASFYANNKDGNGDGKTGPSGLMGMATKVTDFFKGEDGKFSMGNLTKMFSGEGGITGGLSQMGGKLMDGLIDGVKGMAGGIGNTLVNGLVTKWTDDAALGQTLGGLTQGIAGIVTLNPMDVLQGGLDAIKGLTTGIFGDKKAEKKISKAINEHNKKVREAIEDFNFQAMMSQLESINSGIRLVSDNVVKYGLKGSYQFYASQAGGNLTGSAAREYVSHEESYGGSWFRRRRRKKVYAAVTETMDIGKIGDLLGGDYKEALGDFRLNSAAEMQLAMDGAKKIQEGIREWQEANASFKGKKGDRGRQWAQSEAAMDATNQILKKLEDVQKLYAENLDKFNSQLFGFTVEFIDEFGNVAESTEDIKDVIITEWTHLSSILDSISSNMFQEVSNLGDSIYEAVFGGISDSLAKSDAMVELGGELSNLVFELSKKFLPEGTDIDLVGNRTQEQVFSDILDVMDRMKEEEQKLKDFAQTISEGMLALGGDIKELRPYLSIDFQTMETQVGYYQEKFDEAFEEIRTDIYNSLMNGKPIEISKANLEEFNTALENYIKSQQSAKDTTDWIADQFTEQFIKGETKYPFEDVSEFLTKEFVEIRDLVSDFFTAEDFDSAISSFGSSIGQKITNNIIDKMLDTSKYRTALGELYKNVDTMMNKGTSVTFKDLAQLAQDTQKYGLMLDQERQKIQAMRDLFDFNSEVVYDTTQDTINYQTSSSKESVYNIYQTNNFDIGNFVSTRATMEEFSEMVAPYMAKAFDNLGLT